MLSTSLEHTKWWKGVIGEKKKKEYLSLPKSMAVHKCSTIIFPIQNTLKMLDTELT